MPIRQYLAGQSYSPEMIDALGKAFSTAVTIVKPNDEASRTELARLVIRIAGERIELDSALLCNEAVAAFTNSRPSQASGQRAPAARANESPPSAPAQ